ncbi:porphobilinogen synthase [Chloroflexota bacterium]
MKYPNLRLRRLRVTPAMRSLVRENDINIGDLIYPLFIEEGEKIRQEIPSMPGIFRFSPDELEIEIKEIAACGILGVLLFGIPKHKDATGSAAIDPKGVVQQAIRIIKKAVPDMLVFTDVCLCEYTSHGHCGVVCENTVDNDKTLPLLARMAVSHAEAGADVVAPSDMMDGRVETIRMALDKAGYENVPILSYAAKYASAFFGPFREAAESVPQFGDRRSYQMDPANAREAMREVEQDLAEGADMIIIKPALAYADIIRNARERFDCPIAAYNVSGEYSMVKAATASGWIDEEQTVKEILISMKRAGADFIITYHAKDIARWLGSAGPR